MEGFFFESVEAVRQRITKGRQKVVQGEPLNLKEDNHAYPDVAHSRNLGGKE